MRKKRNTMLVELVLSACFLCGCQETAAGNQITEEALKTEEPEAQEIMTTEEPVKAYDQTQQFEAGVLNDGDELTGGTYTASKTDESVLEISGNASASVTGSLLKKVSGEASSADASSFRGVNSAVRVYDGASLTLKDCTIISEASDATGVFAYADGTIYISDSVVTVTGGGAGGVQVAGGGKLYGNNLTVTSSSKAAIRSDKGGGTMVLDGGSYTATGKNGCPSIYSTADITVRNAALVSEKSRAVIIEGKNSVTLENCELSGNDQSEKTGSVHANVLLYQSASGDASEGTSVFTMKGGKMTSASGAMFYCTNTRSIVNLEEADLCLSDEETLFIVSAGRWGKDGRNGGDCTVNAVKQKLEGNIIVDDISSLQINMTESTFKGTINSEGNTSVVLDENSTWTLTGDSYITSFTGKASNIISGGYTLYVNGTALSGTN